MNRRRWFVTAALLAAVLVALIAPATGAARAQDTLPAARVRFLHAVPGAPSVDVYLDGMRVAADLPFGAVTPHFAVEGQEHQVALRQAGTGPDSPTLIEVPVPLVPSLAFTVVVQGQPDALQAALYEDILDEINPGMARLTAINAMPDAEPIDVLTSEGGPLLQGVTYGAQFGTVNINTGVQNLVIVPGGGAVEDQLVTIGDVPLRSGMLYTFVALGTAQGDVAPSALVIASPVNLPTDGGAVQIAHGSADAPAVDVYANDTLLAPAVEPGEVTGHMPLPAGDYALAVRPAGAPAADSPMLTQDVTLGADNPAVTVAVTGQAEQSSLALQVFDNPVSDLTPRTARVAVVNAVVDATASVTLSDGMVLASDVAETAQAEPVDVAPGDYMMTVTLAGPATQLDLAIPEMTYYGGTFYTVLVYGGGDAPIDATVQATPIQVTPQSVPETEQAVAVAVEPTVEPTEALTEGPAEAVTEITEAAPAESEVVPAEPTAAPSVEEQTELVPTTPTAPSELVTEPAAETPAPLVAQPAAPVAYVDLNPGANLHCRELPGPDKLSLGLIPSGATLTVLGRPGEATLPETGNPTPLPTPTMEAVEEVWLAVRWEPEGGGYVDCWVSAQFLRVEWQGRLLDTLDELMELPTVPFNQPGLVAGADVQRPTPVYDAVVATVQLEPGVSLQLRRAPNTTAEALDRVPSGAQLEILGYAEAPSEGLVGQPTNPNWYYVRYRTENGGATIGWVSAEYVSQPTRFNRPVELTDLTVIDVEEQGYYELPGEAPVIPLEQQKVMGTVNLNPGANLNLRDQPTQDGRVVIGIPTGESMVINGRNGDGTWVQVTYSTSTGDMEGWVSAQYLLITRGGQPYDVMQLPALTEEVTAETPTPTGEGSSAG